MFEKSVIQLEVTNRGQNLLFSEYLQSILAFEFVILLGWMHITSDKKCNMDPTNLTCGRNQKLSLTSIPHKSDVLFLKNK